MTEHTRHQTERLAKALIAAMALLFALAALVIYGLQARLGIEEESARLIATAFLLTGIIDALVLYGWDRIFKRGV
jgi:hypothetical protein